MHIEFTVPGPPVPQGAIRTFVAGGRAHGRHANASQLQDYRARIAMAANEATARAGAHAGQLIDGPVEIDVSFYVQRPKGHFGQGRNAGILKPSAPRFPTTRPDLSHLVRAFEDGLTGVVIKDDSQIVSINADKDYDDRPRTEARIELLAVTVGTEKGDVA